MRTKIFMHTLDGKVEVKSWKQFHTLFKYAPKSQWLLMVAKNTYGDDFYAALNKLDRQLKIDTDSGNYSDGIWLNHIEESARKLRVYPCSHTGRWN